MAEGRGVADSGVTYRDTAFPACPQCGSPNVWVEHRWRVSRYICLERDCKARGPCEIEGSSGARGRRAVILHYVILAILIVCLILALTGHMPG